jgi:hypothetical protein
MKINQKHILAILIKMGKINNAIFLTAYHFFPL